ncbi:TetR/AcrR family transcriptional regulator [Streptomyces mirabilis]|uniref:TetR/AcrR family transcriptional regulator n=1 Tax=Streptomyces mirabilis TaxID=68239 RepID=UPI00364B839D
MARPRKFDESTVLKAARQQFWRTGYAATSMADLCEATRVASQSLYGAFGSKHGLFVKSLRDYCEQQVSGLQADQESAESAWEWLMAAVTFGDSGRLGLTEDGCYLSGSAAALARQDDDVSEAARRTYDRIIAVFTTALQRARAAGEIRSDTDIEKAALSLLAAMQGIEFLRKSGIDDAQFQEAKAGIVDTASRAYGANRATRG